MKKICFITHGLNIGGAENLVVKLAKNIKDIYIPSLLVLDLDGDLKNELIENQISYHILKRKPGIKLRDFLNASRYLSSINPQIIHAHQYTALVYAIFYKIFYSSKVKIIFTEHGRHYPDNVSLKRKLANKIFSFLINKVTAVCDFAAKAIYHKEGIKKEIAVIYNGIDIESYEKINLRADLEIKEEQLIIGYVGSLRPVKNPMLLLESYIRLRQSYPNCCLVFLGDGSLKSQLVDKVSSKNIEDVFFLGNQYPAGKYIQEFDIFVQPSLSEAHSLALLEAMALEKAVLVSNVGGAPESINGINGMMFSSDSIDDLVSKLEKLVVDSEFRKQLGLEAKKTYQKRLEKRAK